MVQNIKKIRLLRHNFILHLVTLEVYDKISS